MLIAMPGMSDPRFDKALIYICAHSDDGAMGLIVNKPARGVTFLELLNQLNIEVGTVPGDARVMFGGPVEHARGFVLHSTDGVEKEGTLAVHDGFGMTATQDILEDIALGRGPSRAVLALGYAGWGPKQLDQELLENGWLICDASEELMFGEDSEQKWTIAINSLGIDPLMLSSYVGHA